ncbi:ATP-dependent phosphofructokinase / diphosphate-dependent phosphofructokinase [uncultured Gammaproteobacteria bacterium]
MRIGILTGGGDVPGLNPCMKTLVNRAADNGWEVFGFRLGWAGPLNYNPDLPFEQNARWVQRLTRDSVRTIDRTGGTILHTSRTNPQRTRASDLPAFLKDAYPFAEGKKTVDCTAHVLKVMEKLGIDAMVPIGGDDTLSYAVRLHREGFKVVAVPKTMDNDVNGTDYCIGFSTAVTRSVDFINALRTPTGSHERIAVIELFGRNCGETALVSGFLADADRALICEVPFDVHRLAAMLVEDRQRNQSNYAVVVISEGAVMLGGDVIEYGEADAYGHRKLGGVGQSLGDALKKITGIDIVNQQIAYLMRAGAPDSLDRMVAMSYGGLAIQQLESGVAGVMVALRDGRYTTVPIDTCLKAEKRVDVAHFYDSENYRPQISQPLGKPMFMY